MGHKFDDRWSCFIIIFEDDYNHHLESIGTMYLTFNRNGVLYRGHLEYNDVDGREHRLDLSGRADTGFNPRTLQLESEETHLFEGTLTFESDDHENMAITGRAHLPEDTPLRALVASKTDQDDPPWVILKP